MNFNSGDYLISPRCIINDNYLCEYEYELKSEREVMFYELFKHIFGKSFFYFTPLVIFTEFLIMYNETGNYAER